MKIKIGVQRTLKKLKLGST